ncbi:sigma-54-dependent transcriptional regulator [Beijerinckia indica]|uniref:Two component, sigma54 specific, transcriptional regulator, Fis family n=1 Tax=Beijerinckia indica subsp. indica (strain ATCC 9039 / DSM 1715 / NCIMB 8712) TaxID=395963 RepID=B2ICF2_BEII9|nr:sigma-54 dependent transcriptional regulator [Beijerinckia indica]ACB93841.1 two component, sigma54 specific, transcriptional regulator, Fis family [Beijerinckia indica subsp. indica ATCC 9039]
MDVAFIDDDEILCAANVQALVLAGLDVVTYHSAMAALDELNSEFTGVVVSDIRMPGIDGLQFFKYLKKIDPDLPVILITGHGDISMAVDALRDGVYDFISKPYTFDRLLGSIRHALESRRLVLENRRLKRQIEASAINLPLLGSSPAMERLRQTLHQLADADVDVLIEGETGTGKEVVANTLHQWSHRSNRPFVALNCGALPESVIESELFGHEAGAFTGAVKKRVGRIEHAHGGTLFLDEIESMPPVLQVKLLRVLETREIAPLGTNNIRHVDIRVVAASKTDLRTLVERNSFREDLYYRLHVAYIHIPPLRERKADVSLLFGYFLANAAKRFRRSPVAITEMVRHHLNSYDWPGNVRELVHYAERVALGLVEEQKQVSAEPEATLRERMDAFEADQIRAALAANSGDIQETVKSLGIARKTLYDKLHRYSIDQTIFRGTHTKSL